MASKNQMTGMRGVYLAAAELTRLGLIVSITSRNARGADLLATDQSYKNTWSIQVKTSWKPVSSWPIGKDYKTEVSNSHIYIFINLKGDGPHDYYIVPSLEVAHDGQTDERPNSTWYGLKRRNRIANDWSIFQKAPENSN